MCPCSRLVAVDASNVFVQKNSATCSSTFESETLQISRVFSPDKYDIVYPSISVEADARSPWWTSTLQKHGTVDAAKEYMSYLWSDEGQALAVKYYFRPRSEKLLAENAAIFPKIELVTVDGAFGGWDTAQKTHFADGGYFDQICGPGK